MVLKGAVQHFKRISGFFVFFVTLLSTSVCVECANSLSQTAFLRHGSCCQVVTAWFGLGTTTNNYLVKFRTRINHLLIEFILGWKSINSINKWLILVLNTYTRLECSSLNRHLNVVEGFEHPNDPRSYVALGLMPLVGSPKANRS